MDSSAVVGVKGLSWLRSCGASSRCQVVEHGLEDGGKELARISAKEPDSS